MARFGMDVDQVEQASRELKAKADQISTVVSDIDRVVNGLLGIWDGPDAQQFVHDWWPEHKNQLVAVSSHISGLGQAAWNNAQEQRNVSGH